MAKLVFHLNMQVNVLTFEVKAKNQEDQEKQRVFI